MKFCLLETDEKTYHILKSYIDIINKHEDFDKFDNLIQIDEIKRHNELNRCDGALSWIANFAAPYRMYLNSIKELALLFIATEREPSWDNFYFFVKKMNQNKNILDHIL